MDNKSITVIFVHPITDQLSEAELDPNITAESVIRNFVACNFIPNAPADGGYALYIGDTGRVLRGAQRLVDGGVQDNGLIRICGRPEAR